MPNIELSELALFNLRRTLMHTSALPLGYDFAHSLYGASLPLSHWWHEHHSVLVTGAVFGATLIAYIDGLEGKAKVRPLIEARKAGRPSKAPHRALWRQTRGEALAEVLGGLFGVILGLSLVHWIWP